MALPTEGSTSLVSIRMPRWIGVVLAATTVLLMGYILHALFTIGGTGADDLFQKWINDAICLLAACAVLVRALLVRRERAAWTPLGLGLVSRTAGNICYSLFLINVVPLPVPSVADGLWLGIYPFSYAALILLLLGPVKSFNVSMSLDGIIAATAAASVSAAVVVGAVLAHLGHGSVAETGTNLAYPLADLILLGLVLGALAFNHWRLDRMWTVLAVAFGALTLTDGLFLYKVANGTYAVGTWIDAGWLVAALLLAVAAWQPAGSAVARQAAGQGSLVVPELFGLLGLGILVWDHFHRVDTLALVLASISVFTVIARMALAFAENHRLARREAKTLIAQNETLDADRKERKRLLARAVEVAEHERMRIALELHDGPIQRLTALAFRLDVLAMRIARGQHEDGNDLVAEIRDGTETLQEFGTAFAA